MADADQGVLREQFIPQVLSLLSRPALRPETPTAYDEPVFLNSLIRRNPSFLEAAIALHQEGSLPANCYVVDLDTVRTNTQTLRDEAARYGLEVFAMTKQVGRNPDVLAAIRGGGIDACVAVDMQCARVVHRCGLRVGNVGHLVQVPRAEARVAASMHPGNWTVFSLDKAREAAQAASEEGYEQPLLARIHSPGDHFDHALGGGFPADLIVEIAEQMDALHGARFAGITTYPALIYNPERKQMLPTCNLGTLQQAADRLHRAGRDLLHVNAAGSISTALLEMLADRGVSQVEPGHALTGTSPLHAVRELAERPAAFYLTEISHRHGGAHYVFGGGLYISPVFPDPQPRALVAREPDLDSAMLISAEMPAAEAVDYYGILHPTDPNALQPGDTVIYAFRMQAFVTRAYVAGISGMHGSEPRITGIWTGDGSKAFWPA